MNELYPQILSTSSYRNLQLDLGHGRHPVRPKQLQQLLLLKIRVIAGRRTSLVERLKCGSARQRRLASISRVRCLGRILFVSARPLFRRRKLILLRFGEPSARCALELRTVKMNPLGHRRVNPRLLELLRIARTLASAQNYARPKQ